MEKGFVTWNTNEKAKKKKKRAKLPYNKVGVVGGDVNTHRKTHSVNAKKKEMVRKKERKVGLGGSVARLLSCC